METLVVKKSKGGGEKLGFGELGRGGKKKMMAQGGRGWWQDMLAYHQRDGCRRDAWTAIENGEETHERGSERKQKKKKKNREEEKEHEQRKKSLKIN